MDEQGSVVELGLRASKGRTRPVGRGGALRSRALAALLVAALAVPMAPAPSPVSAIATAAPAAPATPAPVPTAGQAVVADAAPAPKPEPRVDASLFPAPEIITPAGSSWSRTPVLEWTAVPGATQYWVEIYDPDAQVFPGIWAWTTSTRWAPTVMLAPGVHTWRVAAGDNGGVGAYAISTFTRTGTLATPALTTPADDAVINEPEVPLLQWSTVDGAGGYEIQHATSADMADAFSGFVYGTSWVPEFAKGGQDWWWRVRALGQHASTAWTGAWSEVRHYSVTYATAPTVTEPADGAEVRDIELAWDPMPGARDYVLQITPGPSPDWGSAETREITTQQTRYQWSDPSAPVPATWSWRVRARDHALVPGPWSTPRTVTRILSPAPELLAPIGGAHTGSVPLLSWTPTLRASTYLVQIATDAGFTTGVQSLRTTETSVDLVTGILHLDSLLVDGTTYFWRVRGLDEATELIANDRPASPWSASATFVYDPTPSALLAPADGATVEVPTLSWVASDADVYRITIKDKHGATVVQDTTMATTYTPRIRLTVANGPFTWQVQRVIALNDTTGPAGWTSATRSFSLAPLTATATEPVPLLPSGTHGVTSPTLTWTPVVGADHYLVFLAAIDGTIADPVPSDEAIAYWSDSILAYPAFTFRRGQLDRHLYTYRIVAYDAARDPIAVGPAATFILDPLAAPVLTGPADCLTVDCPAWSDTPRLSWEPVEGASFYALDAPWDSRTWEPGLYTPATEGGFSMDALGVDPYAHPGLYGATTWQVRACVEGFCGPAASATYRLRLPTTPLLTPADGAIVVGPQITVRWDDLLAAPADPGTLGTPQSEAKTYAQKFGTGEGLAATSLTGESGTWLVWALTGAGTPGAYSERSYTISLPGPEPLAPADAAVFDRTPALTWAPQPYVRHYDVAIYRVLPGGDEVYVETWSSEHAGTGAYHELGAGTYRWSVRTEGDWGQSSFGSARTFTITAPAGPSPLTPAAGLLETDDLLFTWAAVDGATSYGFQAATDAGFVDTVATVGTVQPAWAPTFHLPQGQLYWRVTAYGPSGGELGRSAVRAQLLDTGGPVGNIAINGGAVWTRSRTVTLTVPATDAGSGVTNVALSNDGTAWTTRTYAPVQSWTLPTVTGKPTVRVRWRDGVGHWSATSSVWIQVDTLAPVAWTPTAGLASSGPVVAAGGTLPVVVTWPEAEDSGSGVVSYDLAIRVDGGAPKVLATGLAARTARRNLPPGHAYQLGVRARDAAANLSGWAWGASFRPTLVSEKSAAITWRGTWRAEADPTHQGGATRYATDRAASATFTFTGRQVAWVTAAGPDRGVARVFVDGVLARTVDLAALPAGDCVVAFRATFGATGTHTVRIVVLGTAGRPRVDVDGFLVQR